MLNAIRSCHLLTNSKNISFLHTMIIASCRSLPLFFPVIHSTKILKYHPNQVDLVIQGADGIHHLGIETQPSIPILSSYQYL